MKYNWLALFLLSISMVSFAVKRKAPLISNPMPRFVLQNVDNRTMFDATIINNNQLIPVSRGINGVFLPIDLEPTNNPQLERSVPLPIALKGFFDGTFTDLVMFSINKLTSPTDNPNIQSIALRLLLTRINNENNSIQIIQTQDYSYNLHRADQDNYQVNIIIDGPNLSNSSFNLQRYVTRGRD